jgi:predicted component of type VI protein secretion system
MNYHLTIIKGPGTARVVRLTSEVVTVGRQEDCQVRIVSSEVSRKHCQLFEKKGLLLVKDLKSSNGTFVNGKRIQDQQVLESGNILTVGPITFRVDQVAAPAAAAAPSGNPGDTAPGIPVAAVIDEPAAEDEFEIDFGEDAAAEAIASPSDLTTAAPKVAAQKSTEKKPTAKDDTEEKEVPAIAEPQAEGSADDAIADFLLDLQLDDDDKN